MPVIANRQMSRSCAIGSGWNRPRQSQSHAVAWGRRNDLYERPGSGRWCATPRAPEVIARVGGSVEYAVRDGDSVPLITAEIDPSVEVRGGGAPPVQPRDVVRRRARVRPPAGLLGRHQVGE